MVEEKIIFFDMTIGEYVVFTLVGVKDDKFIYQSEITGWRVYLKREQALKAPKAP